MERKDRKGKTCERGLESEKEGRAQGREEQDYWEKEPAEETGAHRVGRESGLGKC